MSSLAFALNLIATLRKRGPESLSNRFGEIPETRLSIEDVRFE